MPAVWRTILAAESGGHLVTLEARQFVLPNVWKVQGGARGRDRSKVAAHSPAREWQTGCGNRLAMDMQGMVDHKAVQHPELAMADKMQNL